MSRPRPHVSYIPLKQATRGVDGVERNLGGRIKFSSGRQGLLRAYGCVHVPGVVPCFVAVGISTMEEVSPEVGMQVSFLLCLLAHVAACVANFVDAELRWVRRLQPDCCATADPFILRCGPVSPSRTPLDPLPTPSRPPPDPLSGPPPDPLRTPSGRRTGLVGV
eukprot:989865-Prorocentrum_minimum.AAC.1